MADHPPERAIIQTEQVFTRKPVSESLLQPIAGALNLLQLQLAPPIEFFANGSYRTAVGRNRVETFRFPANGYIWKVTLFSGEAGLSGTTEVDCLLYTSPGGVGASIFTTTPKADSSAASNVWIGIGESVVGMTAPVLTSNPNLLSVNEDDVLQMKILSAMGGNPKDLKLQIDWLIR